MSLWVYESKLSLENVQAVKSKCGLLKGTRSSYAELEYDFEECYKALSGKLDWENTEGVDYPFDLSKPLPLITCGNRIEDMVPNIWSPVKVAYDKYALWGISHWKEQHKSFYAFARGMQSRGDVYLIKRILAVTHVSVMSKHGYGYLEEIVVRIAENALYRFKEGDFLRLWIKDIEDMLLLVKRVEDLQLGVKSYQKKINVTKPDTTRPDLRKRHPYTPYKDPQGFIYVDDHKEQVQSALPSITKTKCILRNLEAKEIHHILKRSSDINHYDVGKSLEATIKQAYGRFDTLAGNLVKKILLKLNLSDHRSILIDLKKYLKMVMEKRDEIRIVIEARLVVQGYRQEEGIDYDETFALVARLEAIRIFFAFATYMNFIVYQMNVKSAFLNGKLKEEVYDQQPPGFESSEFPNHVCKLDDAVVVGLQQEV
ncbi:uncharacterized mitochondrial protein-like protein [Tanacetum coccineum]|uniref:Uncharacterized mitochondrial protein-like protein n=1 Tax=Tanacetum coccineum TaxID=301880 RepID=A0ABQ5IMI4_9ASTR